jgi:hypothetical protein
VLYFWMVRVLIRVIVMVIRIGLGDVRPSSPW